MGVIGDWVRRNAWRYPDKDATVFEGTRFTWEAFNNRVNSLSNSMVNALGLKKGDKVAILQQNSHRYLELYFALSKAGLVAVPINYGLAAREILFILNDSKAEALIVDDEYLPVINEITHELKLLQRYICIGSDPSCALNYEEMISNGNNAEPDVTVSENDVIMQMYTSGTTGFPKGVMTTHKNMEVNNVNILMSDRKASSKDIPLVTPPLCSMGAVFLSMCYMYLGCTHVILKKFEPLEVLKAVETFKITNLQLTPTMLNTVLKHPDFSSYDTDSLRLVFYGGSSMPVPLLRDAINKLKCEFVQGYGSTENLVVCLLSPEDHVLEGPENVQKRLASGGREALNSDVRIFNDHDGEVPRGEVGEIVVRGDSVMKGYWNRDEANKEVFRNDWLHTGDLGYMDRDGYVYVVDRKKDMFVSGGVNIYPREIEDIFYAHDAVLECAVIGVPDEKLGEIPVAVIVLKSGMSVSEEELVEHCKKSDLAECKKPGKIVFVDQPLPKNASGKIVKRLLRNQTLLGVKA
ncbi:MAG: long-chain-fatty-acid--CoA ligase [Peptococcaceae bacterium]|jgi:acyl-CoA synthetase (AMP-forming)/AMP-acid ligase II|nr:long-chain-fatty-acid--CoA ligase [Peptococcaceae bacterium]